jgi:hypothetical protein
MRISLLVRYFFGGVLMTNSMPHLAISLTGRRNMTPFGRESSAKVNLLWGLLNLFGGVLVIRSTDRKARAELSAHDWLLALLAGGLVWSVFMVVVEASGFTHRQAVVDRPMH